MRGDRRRALPRAGRTLLAGPGLVRSSRASWFLAGARRPRLAEVAVRFAGARRAPTGPRGFGGTTVQRSARSWQCAQREVASGVPRTDIDAPRKPSARQGTATAHAETPLGCARRSWTATKCRRVQDPDDHAKQWRRRPRRHACCGPHHEQTAEPDSLHSRRVDRVGRHATLATRASKTGSRVAGFVPARSRRSARRARSLVGPRLAFPHGDQHWYSRGR